MIQNKNLLSLFSFIENNSLASIIDSSRLWNDEPHIHRYHAYLNNNSYISTPFSSMGTSYKSADEALLRCLGEFLERFSLFSIPIKKVVDQSKSLLPIFDLHVKNYIEKKQFLIGDNALNNSQLLVPIQLIFFNQLPPSSYEVNSNGAAGGFSKEEAFIRSVYELIERDAFMTMYLLKISPPQINPKNIQSSEIQELIQYCNRYNLTISVFDITNNLTVPSFMSRVTDDSGSLNLFSIGLKSSLNRNDAILGSIEEAISMRQLIRANLQQVDISKSKFFSHSISSRMKYWLNKKHQNNADFLWEGPMHKLSNFKKKNVDAIAEIKEIIKQMNYTCISTDISNEIYSSLHYYVVKSFIPELQPFYLNEKKQIINMNRLESVSRFFGKKTFQVNTTPHPFL